MGGAPQPYAKFVLMLSIARGEHGLSPVQRTLGGPVVGCLVLLCDIPPPFESMNGLHGRITSEVSSAGFWNVSIVGGSDRATYSMSLSRQCFKVRIGELRTVGESSAFVETVPLFEDASQSLGYGPHGRAREMGHTFLDSSQNPIGHTVLHEVLGLRWKCWGHDRPTGAGYREICHQALARALYDRQHFTLQEWQSFDITGLEQLSYILSDPAGDRTRPPSFFSPCSRAAYSKSDRSAEGAECLDVIVRAKTDAVTLVPCFSVQRYSRPTESCTVLWRASQTPMMHGVTESSTSILMDGDVICFCPNAQEDEFGQHTPYRYRFRILQTSGQYVRSVTRAPRFTLFQVGVDSERVPVPLDMGTSMLQAVDYTRTVLGLERRHEEHVAFSCTLVPPQWSMGGASPARLSLGPLHPDTPLGAWADYIRVSHMPGDRTALQRGGVEIRVFPPPYELTSVSALGESVEGTTIRHPVVGSEHFLAGLFLPGNTAEAALGTHGGHTFDITVRHCTGATSCRLTVNDETTTSQLLYLARCVLGSIRARWTTAVLGRNRVRAEFGFPINLALILLKGAPGGHVGQILHPSDSLSQANMVENDVVIIVEKDGATEARGRLEWGSSATTPMGSATPPCANRATEMDGETEAMKPESVATLEMRGEEPAVNPRVRQDEGNRPAKRLCLGSEQEHCDICQQVTGWPGQCNTGKLHTASSG